MSQSTIKKLFALACVALLALPACSGGGDSNSNVPNCVGSDTSAYAGTWRFDVVNCGNQEKESFVLEVLPDGQFDSKKLPALLEAGGSVSENSVCPDGQAAIILESLIGSVQFTGTFSGDTFSGTLDSFLYSCTSQVTGMYVGVEEDCVGSDTSAFAGEWTFEINYCDAPKKFIFGLTVLPDGRFDTGILSDALLPGGSIAANSICPDGQATVILVSPFGSVTLAGTFSTDPLTFTGSLTSSELDCTSDASGVPTISCAGEDTSGFAGEWTLFSYPCDEGGAFRAASIAVTAQGTLDLDSLQAAGLYNPNTDAIEFNSVCPDGSLLFVISRPDFRDRIEGAFESSQFFGIYVDSEAGCFDAIYGARGSATACVGDDTSSLAGTWSLNWNECGDIAVPASAEVVVTALGAFDETTLPTNIYDPAMDTVVLNFICVDGNAVLAISSRFTGQTKVFSGKFDNGMFMGTLLENAGQCLSDVSGTPVITAK